MANAQEGTGAPDSVAMAPDEAQINYSISDTPPHVEKMKEPTRDTFVMLLNPFLEVM